ncbi:multifunctional CCA addition/repair protein [Candidatus Erwinia haradaeae]|uniref:CCA-adding enzyme n=1 Tax=Candidatus Erwinia haradaeae TaxID=1922217 RepID=A0A451D9U8_9GAMM|nr:multifunctional CCA addition/repair protein [Candidatus Erwinia haradaeae]VFP83054.1 Multifunctional CCA protein [Candidatus Erwinia haradaeae]
MEIYLVGGAVRDTLLKLPLKDKDWVVVGGSPQRMLDLGYKQVGRHFPVFLHPKTHEEYALARTEIKTGHGYVGFLCYYQPDVTLMQDLARRDVTVNAIAQDQYGEYYDPHGGRLDIQKRILRHVSSSFSEDPLRVLRIARFAAYLSHLNFRIADETLKLMKEIVNSGELQFLTSPRVWKEIEKALQTHHPQVFFKVLEDCGALKMLFPEIYSIVSFCNVNLDNALTIFSRVAQYSTDLVVRFASLFYGLKNILALCINPSFHDKYGLLGIPTISALCQRLNVPSASRSLVLLVIEHYSIIHNVQCSSPNQLIHFFNRIDAWRKPLRIQQISLILDAESETCATYKNCSGLKSKYLYDAWKMVSSVSVQEVIHSGFIGRNIGEELLFRQSIALKEWQSHQNQKEIA